MKKSLSFFAAAATATVVLLSVPSTAKAQVAFGGTFRGPHGVVSIGVGPFVPQVGGFVPSPYCDQVYYDPAYGYGFYYDSQWIACTRYGSRWIIARRPVVYHSPVIYGQGYGYGGYGHGQSYGYGHRYGVRPYGDYGHRYGYRDYGRRNWDGRRDGHSRWDRDNHGGWERR